MYKVTCTDFTWVCVCGGVNFVYGKLENTDKYNEELP